MSASAPWSEKDEKSTTVDDDEFMIIDSEDSDPTTTNKRVKKSTVLSDINSTTINDLSIGNSLEFPFGSTQTEAATPEGFNWHIET